MLTVSFSSHHFFACLFYIIIVLYKDAVGLASFPGSRFRCTRVATVHVWCVEAVPLSQIT